MSALPRRVHTLRKRFVQSLAMLAFGLLLAASPPTRADEIALERAAIVATDEGFVLNADFEFEINPRLEEALKTGLTLYFVIEFEMTRGRWYWFDERTAQRSLVVRLWYHALTRQYRLASGALSQSFPTLAEAQRTLARLRGLNIADRGSLSVDTPYVCFLRMRLDNTKLPRPLQVSIAGNRDWALASNWHRWVYQAGPPVPTTTNGDRPGSDKPGSDKLGGDKTEGDKPSSEKPSGEKP